MATNIIQETNRTCLAIANAATSLVFAGIRIPRQNHDTLIKSITWGALISDTTDRTNYRGQYAAILRNTASIDENSVASPFAPIFSNGVEVLWSGTQNDLSGQNHAYFGSRGIVLSGGDEYMIYVATPLFVPAITGTAYILVSVTAETREPITINDWRMQ